MCVVSAVWLPRSLKWFLQISLWQAHCSMKFEPIGSQSYGWVQILVGARIDLGARILMQCIQRKDWFWRKDRSWIGASNISMKSASARIETKWRNGVSGARMIRTGSIGARIRYQWRKGDQTMNCGCLSGARYINKWRKDHRGSGARSNMTGARFWPQCIR